jgi:hypothetical protein
MKNEALRKYSHEHLTPTEGQRNLVTAVYSAVCEVLGGHRCRQIGSYPRYTAIRPPHDLDILFRAGFSRDLSPNPRNAISEIAKLLKDNFVGPDGLRSVIKIQSHSISIALFRGTEEEFGVDIVPAWETGQKNEFNDDIYRVPELILKGHSSRQRKYERVAEGIGSISFIFTDPIGYIKVAANVNDRNQDFRRSTKCGKKWKHVACLVDDDFKLKSFHLEQIFTIYFRANPYLEIYDALVKFFEELPAWISHAQIPDRADATRKIDAYVDELTARQKASILRARDFFMRRLRAFDGIQDVSVLFELEPRAAAAKAGASSSAAAAPVIITDRSRVTPRSSFGSDK